MTKYFFTSDTHFGHDRDFIYKSRGFSSIEEHDEEIIRRWNSVVSEDDTVFHLGDMMLMDNDHGIECLKRLNGHIVLLRGNHDSHRRISLYEECENVEECDLYATVVHLNNRMFYLSHYPTLVSNAGAYDRIICLHGHTHSKNAKEFSENFCYNVGMDAHNCTPVSIEEIIKEMPIPDAT